MVRDPKKDLNDVIRELGKFHPDAFQFVQEGLSYTVREEHGEMTEVQELLHQYMFENNIDLDELEMMCISGRLPEPVRELVEQAGGLEELNRHVSGQNLCWGLRRYALNRWGAMASAVLGHWNIRRTRDFGEIVFALVDNDFLQKQPHDSIEDFEDVYEFQSALDQTFQIELNGLNN